LAKNYYFETIYSAMFSSLGILSRKIVLTNSILKGN